MPDIYEIVKQWPNNIMQVKYARISKTKQQV